MSEELRASISREFFDCGFDGLTEIQKSIVDRRVLQVEEAGDQRAGQQPSAKPYSNNINVPHLLDAEWLGKLRIRYAEAVLVLTRMEPFMGDKKLLLAAELGLVARDLFKHIAALAVPAQPPVSTTSLADENRPCLKKPDGVREAPSLPVSALRERLEKLIERWRDEDCKHTFLTKVWESSDDPTELICADELAAVLKDGPETPDA